VGAAAVRFAYRGTAVAFLQRAMSTPTAPRRRRTGARLVYGAVAVTVLAVSLVVLVARRERTAAHELWRDRLTSMADDRGEAIQDWVRRGLADATLVADYPTLAYLLGTRRGPPFPFPVESGPRAHLEQLLDSLLATHGYSGAWVLDHRGLPIVARGDAAPEDRVLGPSVVEGGAPRAEFLDGPPASARVVFAAPIGPAGSGIGAVLLAAPAEAWLFRLLRDQMLPSRTAETLLVGRAASGVRFLSPKRHPPAASAAPGWPRIGLLPAWRALTAAPSFGRFRDYRDVPVLAATRRVGGTPWGVVAKVDLEEAEEPARRATGMTAGVAALGLASLLGLGFAFWHRERAEHELELAQAQARARLALDQAGDAILFISQEGSVLDAMGGVERLYRCAASQLRGRHVAELWPPEERHHAERDLRAAALAESLVIEADHLRRDGTRFPVEVSVRVARLEDEEFFVSVVRDAGRRRQAEEALRDSENRYRTLFARNPWPTFIYDLETLAILDANEAAVRGYGFCRDEFLAMSVRDIRPPEEVPAFLEEVERIRAGGGRVPGRSFRHRRKDGSLLEVEVAGAPVTFGGRPARLVIALDVTERRAAEERLRKLSRVVEQSPASIVITDASGAIEYVNPRFSEVSGYSAEEVLGKNPRILKSGETPQEVYEDLWRTIRAGGVWAGDLLNRKKDGTLFWEQAQIGPVLDARGEVTHYVAIKEDITDRKRAETALQETQRQLLQSQKVEAIGRLAGGVAHDFNNLLGVISGYGEMLARRLPATDPGRRHLDQILRAAERAAGLTRQLLAFSRRQVLQPRVVDLNALVADTEAMLRRLIGEDVELSVRADPELASVRVDPGQIEQVVMNLAVNARDAMPRGGRLSIETANVVLDERYARSHEAVKPGRYVMLAISDTGVGMDAATQARIFEPFFTTKPGSGTGLGLATVYGIVKQSGGYIWVYSEPGRGTTFRIYFPRVEELPEAAAAPAPAESPGGHETVLLVEDQEALRGVVRESLEGLGYRVLEAPDGKGALELAAAAREPIHLLLTDVIMPRMSGVELAERLRARHEGLRVVFMSGYTDDVVTRSGLLAQRGRLLQKPFTTPVLARTLREALATPA
jgi:PAS domain S-box-containing protein